MTLGLFSIIVITVIILIIHVFFRFVRARGLYYPLQIIFGKKSETQLLLLQRTSLIIVVYFAKDGWPTSASPISIELKPARRPGLVRA
jgi:hypothetical protein